MIIQTIEKMSGIIPDKIITPKNGGLKGYSDIALKKLNLKQTEQVAFRGEDIPKLCEEYTKRNLIVFGLTGDDLFDEYKLRNPESRLQVIDSIDWYDEKALFSRPSLCLIGKQEDSLKNLKQGTIAINSKYSETSKIYIKELEIITGKKFDYIIYNGDTEKAVKQGLADYCIEIVYSGKSINELNLKVLNIIRQTDIVLIGPKNSVWEKEFATIKDRIKNPKENSYTSKLVKDPEKITRKIAEESYEVIDAFNKNLPTLKQEILDLIYSLMVLINYSNISIKELTSELKKRQK